jgi:hypothetical protein
VTLVTTSFESDAKANAKELGMSLLSVKAIQEPQIVGLSPDRIQNAARNAARFAIEGLTKEAVFVKEEIGRAHV